MKRSWHGWAAVACLAAAVGGVRAAEPTDNRLAAARKFVEKSDRYLHHSRLKRGMKGYGLNTFAGTKIERFGVEIVSVLTGWGPHQDMVLATCSGMGLEKSGIAQGMSGSPIFIQDPRDGKHKMIGALAFGWSFQREPLFGIQPIAQMLAVRGFLPEPGKGKSPPPAEGPAAAAADGAPPQYLRAVLNPKKIDFSRFAWPKRLVRAARQDAPPRPRMTTVTTPLMVSGAGTGTLGFLRRALRPAGIMPMRSGGVGGAQAAAAREAKLAPGSPISVPLVTGDVDWTALGTVTEIQNGRVLAFGHEFFAEGDLLLPMATGYIHTMVSSQLTSFKLGSTLKVVGAIGRDERVGIAGTLGAKAPMTPITVSVHWPDDGRKQTYQYRLAHHTWLTPVLLYGLVFESAIGWRELPEDHTIHHEITTDFGSLGVYRAANVLSAMEMWGVASDVTRPVAALIHNPFGPKVLPKRVTVKLTIRTGDISARIVEVRLKGDSYRPGETLTGTVLLRPYRKPRRKLPIRFELPADLPEGRYSLTVCSAEVATGALQDEMPQRFRPHTTGELFAGIQRTVALQADRLYLRLPLPEGGLAVGTRELPDLPESRADILAEARRVDSRSFRRTLVRDLKTPYVIEGAASANFTVRANPPRILLRGQEE